jgi:methylmalonyl-CoA mutase
MSIEKPYHPNHKVRIVTAASLFDGHDVAINIIRRLIQSSGCEVIHLGHNRSVEEIVNCAIQEDAQAIAITSYQGGHIEYFKYMYDLLREKGGENIKIFGGGGGVILPDEIEELQNYGITRIYSPEDGRNMGLQGMVNDLVKKCDYNSNGISEKISILKTADSKTIARLISLVHNDTKKIKLPALDTKQEKIPVLGITGTGGAGKSSVIDELVRRFLSDHPSKHIAIISVDPTKRKTGGALLGDRIRMNIASDKRIFMRSLATRRSNLALSAYIDETLKILKAAAFDLIILETSGIGQSDTEITEHSDICMYVMTPDYGAATQLEKIDMLDYADIIAINKFDKSGARDALRDVKKQYRRNHNMFDVADEAIPVFGTIASQFNDDGMNKLYRAVTENLRNIFGLETIVSDKNRNGQTKTHIIPLNRVRYLSEITENNRGYNNWVNEQSEIARKMHALKKSIEIAEVENSQNKNDIIAGLCEMYDAIAARLDAQNLKIIKNWKEKQDAYKKDVYKFKVRQTELAIETSYKSLAQLAVPKVALPKYEDWGDILRWSLKENVPGSFPYTAGIYPFKREGEDPTRMFAGEGGPERTNKRFHFLSLGMPAKRLSTAFDSVTLYGHNPDKRPDVYGKIGNSGVSICCLDDMKKLYSGFNLTDPGTSVSMTINGPAPIILAYFMNTAIDQQCELYIRSRKLEKDVKKKIESFYKNNLKLRPVYAGSLPESNDGLGLMLLGISGDKVLPAKVYQQIKKETLARVRGTVQADILKEDQAQNTCIFSTEFALRLMGDVQEFFIQNHIRNFYSVSISGYHIAEAGANPITQLALTLSNGFTYVEYYLSRGMDINQFAPNLSFFFSNGLDPEYAVIGRVARRIWSKAMKYKYKADARSQMLKYHIQTSGRSLHAQEIDFNDMRTTLQALYAIYDNCNSLHTNAYDEAVTTPTEESVRRALAIQLIINKELGLAKNENPLQGSFIIEELTDLVEEAVYLEFDRLTERGGVLGAMETMYQRGKIQEESLYYETLKHSGDFPIVGINTFLRSHSPERIIPEEVIRSEDDEKQSQIKTLDNLHKMNRDKTAEELIKIQQAAVENSNLFEVLMEAVKICSLGQITQSLFEVGGQYRRNM